MQFHAADEWLAEMDREDRPIPLETLEHAAQIVDEWECSKTLAIATSRGYLDRDEPCV